MFFFLLENLELYFRGHDAAYEGLPVLLFCKVYNSGLKIAQIIRPDREVVLECQDLLYYYKCWKRRLGYEHNYKWIFDISMNITSFRPKIDSGIWRCRNKETGEEATLEVKTNSEYIQVLWTWQCVVYTFRYCEHGSVLWVHSVSVNIVVYCVYIELVWTLQCVVCTFS